MAQNRHSPDRLQRALHQGVVVSAPQSDLNCHLLWYIVGEGNGFLLQHSCLGNFMDKGAWQATVHGVTESRT